MANKSTRARITQARSAFKKGNVTSTFSVQDSRIKNSNGTYGTRTLTITIGTQPRKRPFKRKEEEKEGENVQD